MPQLGYRVPGPWRALALRVRVTDSSPGGVCRDGTVGRLVLLDANRLLPRGRSSQTWDRVEILFPGACGRSHSHGYTNGNSPTTEPRRGGWPNGGSGPV